MPLLSKQTTDRAWSYRHLREGEEAPLLQLLVDSFGGWPQEDLAVEPLEHLRWKLQSHPEASRVQAIAVADSRIIASQLSWVRSAKVRDRVLTTRQGVDVAVHPDYEGRGVMRGLRAFALDEQRQAYDFRLRMLSGHPAMVHLAQEEGLGRLAPIDVLLHPIKLWPPSQKRKLSVGGAPSGWLRAAAHTVRRGTNALRTLSQRAPTPWTVREVSRFDPGMDAFWEEASKPYDFIIERTSDYLNWRYCDARAGAFTAKVAERDGRILGYVVVCVRRATGSVADLLTLPDRTDVASSLVGAALAHLRRENVSHVEAWCPPKHPNRPVFMRHGFHVRRRYRRLAYQGLKVPDDELHFLSDPNTAVHLALGDADWI